MGQKGCEERNHGYDNAHIGGEGIGQGDVFQQEVQGNPGQSRSGEQKLLFPAGEWKNPRFQAPEEGISYHKAGKENRNGGEIPQEHLGGDESGSPDDNGHEGGGMAQGALSGTH